MLVRQTNHYSNQLSYFDSELIKLIEQKYKERRIDMDDTLSDLDTLI